jgi:putative transposase
MDAKNRLIKTDTLSQLHNYVGRVTWKTVSLNNTDTNDQDAFNAANSYFCAAHKQETGRWLNNRAENSHLPF